MRKKVYILLGVALFIGCLGINVLVDSVLPYPLPQYLTQQNFILMMNILAQTNTALIGFTALTMSVASSIVLAIRRGRFTAESLINYLKRYSWPVAAFLLSLMISQILPLLYPALKTYAFGLIILCWGYTVLGVLLLFEFIKELYRVLWREEVRPSVVK